MTDRDQRILFSLNGDNGESERFGAYDDFAATDSRSADFAPGLVSLAFIREAIRRSRRFWTVMAVVGLVLGAGVFVERPYEYQAQAAVVLTLGPYESFVTEAGNNQAIAATPAVAGIAVHQLGLQQSASSFVSTYTAMSVTDQLMIVTASGPSSSQAVLRANAVASAFLQFRADQMQAEQNLVLGSIQQQVTQAKQHISSIDAQISQLQSQPSAPGYQSQLRKLQAEQTSATGTLDSDEQAVSGNQTTSQPAVTAAIKGSKIVTVVLLRHSKLKSLIVYAAVGLILGLALGLAIVVVRALVSDRVRRRDDVAYALDAPVRLSVGTLRARRWLPGRAAGRDLDVRRVIAHLQNAVLRNTQGPVGLAVVAVDNAPVVAPVVAALAASCARRGHQVVAADLSLGAHLARQLGVKGSGTHAVSDNGVNFTAVVPDRDDAAPVGPLPAAASAPAGLAQPEDALVALYASADVLLTLVTLDPALGGDHLATWATSAVVVVSTGQSSAEQLRGISEMIRLAGTRLISVVLFGADKSDVSLGLTRTADEQADIGILGL